MPAVIIGELSADGKHFILIANGQDHELAQAARELAVLTPKTKKSNPAGALMMPASFAGAVQLKNTFGDMWRPQPRLKAWLTNQVQNRAPSVGYDLKVAVPQGLCPRPYQVEGAGLIATNSRVLLFDEPGCINGDAVMQINRAGKGSSIKLRDLVARFNGQHRTRPWNHDIPTFVQREVEGVVRLGQLVNAWSSGVKTTYTVTTEAGRQIRATAEHPFLTDGGWRRLHELEVGSMVHVRGTQKAGGRGEKPRYKEVAGLKAHPYARGENRRTSRYRVAFHRLVMEARLNRLDYDEFIQRIRAGDVRGFTFLDPKVYAVHHKDHDHLNNDLSNLVVLTHAEHHALHADENNASHVLFKVVSERVISIEEYGEEETFDIEVADDPHNFIADGFVVHNTGKTITTILGLVERHYA